MNVTSVSKSPQRRYKVEEPGCAPYYVTPPSRSPSRSSSRSGQRRRLSPDSENFNFEPLRPYLSSDEQCLQSPPRSTPRKRSPEYEIPRSTGLNNQMVPYKPKNYSKQQSFDQATGAKTTTTTTTTTNTSRNNGVVKTTTTKTITTTRLAPDVGQGSSAGSSRPLALTSARQSPSAPEPDYSSYAEMLDRKDRYHREAAARGKTAELIGDGSKPTTFPLEQGKNPLCPSINHGTLADILRGYYEDELRDASVTVVDCRFPYEYEGGHIQDAINIYREDQAERYFFHTITPALRAEGRRIFVFHCEFSSERGPKMYRFVREKDREANYADYPALYYPEMYVLNLGYKQFFLEHPALCTPMDYIPMALPQYKKEMLAYMKESKQANRTKQVNQINQRKAGRRRCRPRQEDSDSDSF